MCKKSLLLMIFALTLKSLTFSADPFYTNLLNEGKALYLAGKYDEALESFKIAEFGLIDEKEFVGELYFYYALAQYKKGAITESQLLLGKLKTVSGSPDIDKLPRPGEIERDLSIMVRALKYAAQPGVKPGAIAFFNLFYETWELVKAKKIDAAAAGLKRLNSLDGDESRLHFLEGFLAFQAGDYKKSARVLEKLAAPIADEFKEDVAFYLAYSYLKLEDPVTSEKNARLIKNPDYIHRLMTLMDEIKAAQVPKNKKK